MVVSAVLSSSNPVFWAWRGCVVLTGLLALRAPAQPVDPAMETFTREIQPILNTHCYDCHGSGISKGGVVLDEFTSASELKDPKLWLRALRNVRSGIMPPSDEPRLPAEKVKALEHWIKRQIFELDPAVPDPGRVTVRRLNRTEYRNTVRDLMGVDYDTTLEFPGDDSGHGFDHMGDVLTVSPLLLEKYLDAAQTIVQRAVPVQPAVVAEVVLPGGTFSIRPGSGPESSPPVAAPAEGSLPGEATGPSRPPPAVVAAGMELSYYTRATIEQRVSEIAVVQPVMRRPGVAPIRHLILKVNLRNPQPAAEGSAYFEHRPEHPRDPDDQSEFHVETTALRIRVAQGLDLGGLP